MSPTGKVALAVDGEEIDHVALTSPLEWAEGALAVQEDYRIAVGQEGFGGGGAPAPAGEIVEEANLWARQPIKGPTHVTKPLARPSAACGTLSLPLLLPTMLASSGTMVPPEETSATGVVRLWLCDACRRTVLHRRERGGRERQGGGLGRDVVQADAREERRPAARRAQQGRPAPVPARRTSCSGCAARDACLLAQAQKTAIRRSGILNIRSTMHTSTGRRVHSGRSMHAWTFPPRAFPAGRPATWRVCALLRTSRFCFASASARRSLSASATGSAHSSRSFVSGAVCVVCVVCGLCVGRWRIVRGCVGGRRAEPR